MNGRAVSDDQRRLEGRLRSEAEAIAWPATPDLRAAVQATIAGGGQAAPSTRPAPVRRARRRRLVLRAAVAAILALLVVAGVATALGFRLPGLDLRFVDDLPPAGTGLELGSPVPLAEAVAPATPHVLVPAAMATPDTAFVIGAGDRRMVSLAWRAAGPDDPTLAGTDLALVVTAVPGSTEASFVTKLLGPGTTVAPVDVAGDRGWWISGVPHDLLVQRPDGTVGTLAPRLAGDTLVFAHDGTLYRLESAMGRERTLEIARSMR